MRSICAGARAAPGAIALGRVAPLDDGAARSAAISPRRTHAERLGRAPRPALRARAASARSGCARSNSGIVTWTLNTLPTSPPADGRRLGAGDDLRLGNAPALGGRARAKRAASTSCRSATSSPRDRFGALEQRVERRHRRARPAARRPTTAATASHRRRRSRQRRLRAGAVGRRGGQVRLDVEHLALGTQPIEPGGVAGAPRACRARRRARAADRGARQLALPRLRRTQVRERQPQVGAQRAGRRRRRGATLADTSAAAACTSKPRRPVIGSGCVTIVRFSVTPATDSRSKRHPRIRPAAGRETLGASDVDAGAKRPHARAVRRQPRQRFRFGQRQRLRAGAGRAPEAARTAQSTAPRIAPRARERVEADDGRWPPASG